jgi:hypothetical protein
VDRNALADFDGVLRDGLDFCARVYALFERLRKEPDGAKRLRNRATALEKKLLEELLPICKYVQFYYRPGRYISVRWVDGNQSFDAELEQSGQLVELGYYPAKAYLEVSCAMHENEHWLWRLLSDGRPAFAPEGIHKQRGQPVASMPVVFRNTEHVWNFAPIVAGRIKSKATISYPRNTSLVIYCTLNSLYTKDDWRTLVERVRNETGEHQFREILIFESTREYVDTLTPE